LSSTTPSAGVEFLLSRNTTSVEDKEERLLLGGDNPLLRVELMIVEKRRVGYVSNNSCDTADPGVTGTRATYTC
jgi:hypothetical protein